MIKGCKNYFTLFGMMITSINILLHKIFTQILAYIQLHTSIIKYTLNFELRSTLRKNQIYQKDNHE